jgi:hypothetical protein
MILAVSNWIAMLDRAGMDSTAIDIMVSVYTRSAGTNPWQVVLHDLPRRMPMSLVKKQLEVQFAAVDRALGSGLPFRLLSKDQTLWWHGRELRDDETVGSIGVEDMDLIACFRPDLSADNLVEIKGVVDRFDQEFVQYRCWILAHLRKTSFTHPVLCCMNRALYNEMLQK